MFGHIFGFAPHPFTITPESAAIEQGVYLFHEITPKLIGVRISGMHCENCAERVRRAVDSLDGAACDADAGTGIAIVRLDRSIDDIAIRKKIEEAGYTVDSIEQG